MSLLMEPLHLDALSIETSIPYIRPFQLFINTAGLSSSRPRDDRGKPRFLEVYQGPNLRPILHSPKPQIARCDQQQLQFSTPSVLGDRESVYRPAPSLFSMCPLVSKLGGFHCDVRSSQSSLFSTPIELPILVALGIQK